MTDLTNKVPIVSKSKRTIKEVAVKLLCLVAYEEDDGSVGLSYNEILAEIKKTFPAARTTTKCLIWYAVKIRSGEKGYEGHRLPRRRPRSASDLATIEGRNGTEFAVAGLRSNPDSFKSLEGTDAVRRTTS